MYYIFGATLFTSSSDLDLKKVTKYFSETMRTEPLIYRSYDSLGFEFLYKKFHLHRNHRWSSLTRREQLRQEAYKYLHLFLNTKGKCMFRSKIVGVVYLVKTKTGTNWKGLKAKLPTAVYTVSFIFFREEKYFEKSIRQVYDNDEQIVWKRYQSNEQTSMICLELMFGSVTFSRYLFWEYRQKRDLRTIFTLLSTVPKKLNSLCNDSFQVFIKLLSLWISSIDDSILSFCQYFSYFYKQGLKRENVWCFRLQLRSFSKKSEAFLAFA